MRDTNLPQLALGLVLPWAVVHSEFNDAVDRVRRSERQVQSLLSSTRYFWLRNPASLSERQRHTLDRLSRRRALSSATGTGSCAGSTPRSPSRNLINQRTLCPRRTNAAALADIELYAHSRPVPHLDHSVPDDRIGQASDNIVPPLRPSHRVFERDEILRQRGAHLDQRGQPEQPVASAVRRHQYPVQIRRIRRSTSARQCRRRRRDRGRSRSPPSPRSAT